MAWRIFGTKNVGLNWATFGIVWDLVNKDWNLICDHGHEMELTTPDKVTIKNLSVVSQFVFPHRRICAHAQELEQFSNH